MTKQHDFKGALEDYVEARMDDGSVLISGWIETEDAQALQKALRIADRLQSGEVSGKMLASGHNYLDEYDIFKAMAQQLIAECNGECGDG